MTSEQYERWTAVFRSDPKSVVGFVRANDLLTGVGYVAYPLLLLAAALEGSWCSLATFVVVPAVGFAIVSLIRRAINAPRPYEALPIKPLIAKNTRGKSFPSRHAFSMFMISFSWMSLAPVMGWCLVVASVLLAIVRVLGGVHFPRDVVAGLACAAVFSLVGYVIIPWGALLSGVL